MSEGKPFWERSEALWLLFGIALVLMAAGLGLRDPWPADEPRFALVAKQMVASTQWFFPMRGMEYYPDKPPLFMWAIALFLKLTGSLRLAFLLPSLLSSMVTLALVVDLGKRLWGRAGGFLSGAVLVSIFQFTLQAKTAQIDAMLCMWTTLALYGLMRHLVLGPAWGWYYAAFFSMGLGVITKGVGFLPLLMAIPWLFGVARGWNHLAPVARRPFLWIAGPLAFLGAVGLWLAPMLWLVHQSGNPDLAVYRDNILFTQTVERYGSSWTHIKPFWYYLVEVIPVLWMPATLLLPWLVPAWRTAFRERDGRFLLLLGWVVCVVLFFSASAGKRGVYMLPAVPAVALAVAPHLLGVMQRDRAQLTMLWLMRVFGGVLLGVGIVTLLIPMAKVTETLARYEFNPFPPILALGAVTLGLGSFAGKRRAFPAMALFLGCFWLIHGLWVCPLLNTGRSSAPLMAKVGEIIGPEAELGLVSWKEQTLLFADRPAMTFGFLYSSRTEQLEKAEVWRHGAPNRWLLVPDATAVEGFDPEGLVTVGWKHRRTWYLVRP